MDKGLLQVAVYTYDRGYRSCKSPYPLNRGEQVVKTDHRYVLHLLIRPLNWQRTDQSPSAACDAQSRTVQLSPFQPSFPPTHVPIPVLPACPAPRPHLLPPAGHAGRDSGTVPAREEAQHSPLTSHQSPGTSGVTLTQVTTADRPERHGR